MITVSILRRQDNGIEGFKVEGHANYDKRGRDIVCAGVSSITVGTVNSIEALLGVVMDGKMKNGFLNATLPATLESHVSENVQLLLSSMVVMLQSIEKSYGKYIEIQEVHI